MGRLVRMFMKNVSPLWGAVSKLDSTRRNQASGETY